MADMKKLGVNGEDVYAIVRMQPRGWKVISCSLYACDICSEPCAVNFSRGLTAPMKCALENHMSRRKSVRVTRQEIESVDQDGGADDRRGGIAVCGNCYNSFNENPEPQEDEHVACMRAAGWIT